MHWGLLGPEHLAGSRRTRALRLGSAVRKFNQLAVPGIGGVWFAKQLFLATLGVIVADRLRLAGKTVKAIDTANAIEALACWCAFESNGWKQDARLRGVQKLWGKTNLSFSMLRQTRFYVTQPMRMATVEALVDLGFVHSDSQRFNSFRCTQEGQDFVDAVTSTHKPYNGTIEDYLVQLATKDTTIHVTRPVVDALSPLQTMEPIACEFVRSTLCAGGGRDRDAARRKNALTWISTIAPDRPADWHAKPPSIETDHWRDLRLGMHFFEARDAAIDVLNGIESAMAPLAVAKISTAKASQIPAIEKRLEGLRRSAQRFLDGSDDPTEDQIATTFCRDCVDNDLSQVVRSLVLRDDRVLLFRDGDILPGPAYVGYAQEEESDEFVEGPGAENAGRVPVPEGISARIQNLYLLDRDLHGDLSTFLNPAPADAAA